MISSSEELHKQQQVNNSNKCLVEMQPNFTIEE